MKTKPSALREKNDRDLPQKKRKRGSPVSENEHEKDDARYAKWKLWLISQYQFKYESTTAIRSIVEHSTSEKENLESGNDGISPEVLGKLVKDIWGEKVTIVRRGSRDNVERYYLHLARSGLEKIEFPKNWTCISETDSKSCFVRLEKYLLNKQRAATDVIVQELDGKHVFTIRANGSEQKLASVLNFDIDSCIKGDDVQHKIAMTF